MKNRQSEFSENHINQALFLAMTRPHTRVVHVFPTDELGYAMSNEKIMPAIINSPNIRNQLLGQGAVQRYMFKNGSLYSITGAMKKGGG